MALFEGYERRIDKINEVLKEYGNSNAPISMDYFKGIKVPFAVDRLHYHNYHEISFIIKGNVIAITLKNIS